MKKFLKAIIFLLLVILTVGCIGCQQGGQTSSSEEKKDWREQEMNCNVYPTSYTDVPSLQSKEEIKAYNNDTKTALPCEKGVIESPYYTLRINGRKIPVYAAHTTNGIHSFAYVDVEKDDNSKPFALNTELSFLQLSTVLNDYGIDTHVDVLPEKKGVKATMREDVVTCVIRDYGSYSFVFNRFHEEPLTLMVVQKENKEELFGDYEIEYFEAGDYTTENMRQKTLFSTENKVYYFKKGNYEIDAITLPSNSILYLEQGVYFKAMPSRTGSTTSLLKVAGKSNVKVAGRGLVDFSSCCGSVNQAETGMKNNKSAYGFTSCTDVSFSGITTINSQNWTLCMTDVRGVNIKDCMFFAYRIFADGIMLSDCKNAVVEKNFIRTGDDAFETKSTSASGLTENVLFRNNAAWTDKAVAYGCIYEANHDTRGVRFEDCSVGFALGTWSTHLGSCVIQLGNRRDAITEDITFDGIEVYCSYNPAICSIYTGGSGGAGEGWGHVDNIRFRNITVKFNNGAVLNLRTYDENSSIKNVYLDNIVSSGEKITPEMFFGLNYFRDEVKGGYDADKYLHINTES